MTEAIHQEAILIRLKAVDRSHKRKSVTVEVSRILKFEKMKRIPIKFSTAPHSTLAR